MKSPFHISVVVAISFLTGCAKDDNPPAPPPNAPSTLIAETKSSTEIDLRWTDNSTNEEGFIIERKTMSTNFKDIVVVKKDITSFTDQGLTKNTVYIYRVYSYNQAGKSLSYSNEAQAATSDNVPTGASSLSANAGFNQINLQWADLADNERGYVIERKTGTGNFSIYDSVESNINQYKDSAVLEMTEYTYRVYPFNAAGQGNKSNEAKAFTEADIYTALVAHYSFNNNANDSSQYRNHGTINGSVTSTTDRNGRANSAYAFPGDASSFVDVPMSASLRFNNEITLSAWIYMENGYYNPRILSNEATGFDQYYMSVAGTANTQRVLEAGFYGSSQGTGFCCGGSNGIVVSALAWHHIVFTADANGVSKLYVDGELKKTSNGTRMPSSNYGPNLNIGRNSHPAYDAWGGKLDEIRIYNRALTQTQVTYLYGR